MKIELTKQESKAVISTDGGIIEQFNVAGKDVFFPRQEIDGKMRGGSHVCAPYFGPGARPDQPQHGYARNVGWYISEQAADKVILSHSQTEGEYAGLELILIYQLAPGFHPYYANPVQATTVNVDGREHELAQLGEAVYQTVGHNPTECALGSKKMVVTSESLAVFALWTAHPDRYVCIEPTMAGNSFSERQQGNEEEYLAPGDTKSYSCTVTVY